MLSALADALEAAADHAERQCACEFHHALTCPVAEWRALVREARERAEQDAEDVRRWGPTTGRAA